MKSMLHSHRMAYQRMGRVRRAVHRVLWTIYGALPPSRPTYFLWRMYRRTWPAKP